PSLANALAQLVPTSGVFGLDAPKIELQQPLGSTGFRKRLMRSGLFGEIAGSRQRMKIDLLLNLRRQAAGFVGIKRQAELKKHILQSHNAQPNRTPTVVGGSCL